MKELSRRDFLKLGLKLGALATFGTGAAACVPVSETAKPAPTRTEIPTPETTDLSEIIFISPGDRVGIADENGNLRLTFANKYPENGYDFYLRGKSLVLAVNLLGGGPNQPPEFNLSPPEKHDPNHRFETRISQATGQGVVNIWVNPRLNQVKETNPNFCLTFFFLFSMADLTSREQWVREGNLIAGYPEEKTVHEMTNAFLVATILDEGSEVTYEIYQNRLDSFNDLFEPVVNVVKPDKATEKSFSYFKNVLVDAPGLVLSFKNPQEDQI